MSSLSNNRAQLTNSYRQQNSYHRASTPNVRTSATRRADPYEDNPTPLGGATQGTHTQHALPPPLPPVHRGSATPTAAENPTALRTSSAPPRGADLSSLQTPSRASRASSTHGSRQQQPEQHQQQLQAPGMPARTFTPELQSTTINTSVSAWRLPTNPQNHSTGSTPARRQSPPLPPKSETPAPSVSQGKPSAELSKKTSSGERSDSTAGASTRASKGDDGVEELMDIPLARIQPIEKFFVEYNKAAAEREDDGQPRNDNEVLLEQFAEYTDDDSFFSSSETVIECDPQRLRSDPLRPHAVVSVHNTLKLRALTNGRVPEDTVWNDITRTSWLYQIHNRAIALQYSSFYIFPARWMPRVIVYNILHHWLMEMLILLMILGYAIFQATWSRYPTLRGGIRKPDYIIWADVFYTCLLGFEIIARLFAVGCVLHKRSFFRSPWRCLDMAVLVLSIMECTWWPELWNFTAWRLIRAVKCLTYAPAPVHMKLLAKSLLRSTNRLLYVTILLTYFIFFFGLLGLQLFGGTLHSRCVNTLTGAVTSQLCRSVSTGQYGFYWGHHCEGFFTCHADAFPNPHYDFRSFDDIGHAMLSVFQIMTFQGWSELLQETNDGLAVMAILYYAFTILVCSWIVPSLYLGVFLEKIEKTSRHFVLKQLHFFDHMLTEQRQRMSAMVRLRDYVERDENGLVSHYPAYTLQQRDRERLTDGNTDSGSTIENKKKNGPQGKNHHRAIQATKWTDEQRIQLHLALTRQRDVAEEAERKRRLQKSALGDLIVKQDETGKRRAAGKQGSAPTRAALTSNAQTGTSEQPPQGPNDFALGGRVGDVQHHPAAHAIGNSRKTTLPFAVRQDVQAERLRFLDPYTNGASNTKNDIYNSASALPTNMDRSRASMPSGGTDSVAGGHSRPVSSARPPLSAPRAQSSKVTVTRETAGVVPNRRLMSAHGSLSGASSMSDHGSVSRLHASMTQMPQAATAQREQIEYVINDPEGGDFKYAKTLWQKIDIVRNIAHMFTEGYPRIITQYLWEHHMMQYRYGLSPLSYTNKYEEEALRRLRQRRAQERREEREELRRSGRGHLIDDDVDDLQTEKPWMREEGLVPGSMSPIRMARNIRENAPITVFNYIVYFLIIANAVFNASRFDTMPDFWEEGTFIAGVCFSVMFVLELLIRLLALGPGPFFTDMLILVETTFVIISLFQLGWSRTNTASLFNWVRFLRLFRVISCRPLRRVARVLIHGFPDIAYALVLFTIYMFMWLLLGMSLFGSRMSTIDYSTSDYVTSGRFDTFSHAAYAVAQAFSVNREQWLYLSWSGMRARGGYTVMYFIATVLVAFIFRFFFIAVMTYAWQAQQEEEDSYFMSGSSHGRGGRRSRFARLPFFDFSVWRSFKHIHGGFNRRDVAPDEIYFLNEDMARQLHLVESKDRYYRENYDEEKRKWVHVDEDHQTGGWDVNNEGGPLINGPQYVNIGGRLYRQPSLPATEMGFSMGGAPLHRGQLRFARQFHAVPATTHAVAHQQQHPLGGAHYALSDEVEGSQSPSRTNRRGMVNPLRNSRHSLSPVRQDTSASGTSVTRMAGALAAEQTNNANITLAPRLTKLGNARSVGAGADREGTTDYSSPEDGVAEEDFEHLLLPGPRLRYKSTVENGRRVFESCLDCNTYMQMPLRAPPSVAQRTAEALHAEHCHMAAVRSSQQLVLNALIGYVRMQADHEVTPTKRMVEVVLGQAWSCGMLLFDTIENLSCMDLPERERTWNRTLEALELQQWLLGLHVGEEQVGRATLAYILAHQQRQEAQVQEKNYKNTWKEHAFFVLSPSNPVRRAVSAVVDSIWFEILILCVIYAASVCLAIYVPAEGSRDFGGNSNSDKYVALHALDDIFSIIFVAEMVLKWISMGVVLPVGRAYFWHRWNVFDFVIVVISLASFSTTTTFLRYLKVTRCFRILGPLRYWKWGSSSMSLVVRTIWDSIPILANVCLLMLMNYIVWAILFVSMFMNKMNYCSNAAIVDATQCVAAGYTWAPVQRNFRNFYESLLTTFEISTGAEWLDVIYSASGPHSTLPSPGTNRHPYLGLVFIAYYYVSHFFFFTLFISAVIYCYMLAKSATEDAMGTTIEHRVWLRMQGMILQLKPKPQFLPLNNAISRGLHLLVSNRWFEAVMGLTLVFNMLTMALEWYQMSSTQKNALDALQYLWVAIFTLEVILRLVAHGLRFFTRWAYCWDLLVVILSYIQIGLNTTATTQVPFNVNVLRMLRVGRVLHLIGLVLPSPTHLSLLCEVLKASVSGVISVTFVYIIAVYVFAILGLHFLGYVVPFGHYIDDKYNNFGTFVNALIMVLRLSTLQNWATMLRGSLDRGDYCTRPTGRCGPTNWAPVYYIAMAIGFFLLLSTLYMAVALDKYIAAVRMHSAVTRLDDLRRFRLLWSKRDPNATMWLPSAVLPELLEELRLPLGISDRRNRIELLRLLREYNIPDHNGRVYYYEVLMPLAQRVMAIAFLEADDADTSGSQAPRDIAWHLSERSLGALPASYRKVPPSSVTVAEQYAATLLQAAFRRDRAMRNYFIAKSERWRRGRALCVERGIPYSNAGFGKTSLDGPDPREEGIRRNFNIPKDATLANCADSRIYASPAAARIAAMRETINSQKRSADEESTTLLPAVYRSAIHHDEKRFGPNAPSAIRRHERRDEKLERKRAQEALQRHLNEHTNGGSPARVFGEYDDHDALAAEKDSRDVDMDVSYSGETLQSQPPVCANQYNLDPTDVNYQPPLGTSPEKLRQDEVDRRLNAAATTAAASALLGGIPPSTTPARH